MDEAPTRHRILDAAAVCLQQGGFASARLLSAIARRAGLSRPTVYKYFADADAIRAALIRREVERFTVELLPKVAEAEWDADSFADLIAFTVTYGRNHALLQAALRDVPEIVLPFFTTHADVSIGYVAGTLRPTLLAWQDEGRLPTLDIETLVDALARIALSLLFTSGSVNPDDPDALRAYVRDVISFASVLEPATGRTRP